MGGIIGALVGAVIAVLVGFNHIRRADRLAIADVEEARNAIREQETFLSDLGVDGIFSKTGGELINLAYSVEVEFSIR